MALVCQFVDSIAASPTVRLDLNLGTSSVSWTTLASTTFGTPETRRAISSTMLADGGHVASSSLGFRTLSLRLQVKTATVDDTATEIQKLVRELSRPTNLLKTQIGTKPVFFTTFRSTPDSWDIVTTGAMANISVDVLAEPYALGLKETPISGVTVQTDPASGSGNACFVDVTPVVGEADTPAFIQWPAGAIADGRVSAFAVRRRGTPSGAPFLFQAEAMTQGTNTTTQVNDANFSGSSNNYSRCTFGTATMETRLSIADLGTASVDLRGRYRVLLRYRKNTSTDDINVQLNWGDVQGNMDITNDPVTLPDTTTIKTADLGEIAIPTGYDPVYDGFSGTELAVSDSFFLAVQAERTAGASTLDMDFVVLMPADDRFAYVEWNDESGSASDHWILDGDTNNTHARDSSGRAFSSGFSKVSGGGLPMLTPNQTNRVYMLRDVTGGTSADSWTFTTVTPVSVSYYPRYLVATRPAS